MNIRAWFDYCSHQHINLVPPPCPTCSYSRFISNKSTEGCLATLSAATKKSRLSSRQRLRSEWQQKTGPHSRPPGVQRAGQISLLPSCFDSWTEEELIKFGRKQSWRKAQMTLNRTKHFTRMRRSVTELLIPYKFYTLFASQFNWQKGLTRLRNISHK